MAQTTNAITLKNAVVEYCTTGTTWVAMSGWGNEVKIPDAKRKTGEVYTFDGDTAIIGQSKREPLAVEVTVVYTEIQTDPYLTLHPYFVAGSSIGIRVTPTGAISGNHEQYTSGSVTTPSVGNVIQSIGYPSGKADEATPVVLKMVVLTPSMILSTSTS